ncbi:ABC transporter substrate-binding protein [Archangium lipolyticum]|uniref:ABC transporter substrate-binding protein n=1 Tax=Archangium lipolyticum TaxID=2970465 RepID=UPI00214A1614|nr:ABC transporter substrate-binding protein [Archangium lipolyticum]
MFQRRRVLAALLASLQAGCSVMSGGFQECEEDRDCKSLGDNMVCFQPEMFCVTDPDPFQPDCRLLLGDAKDPRAPRLGALLPLSDAEGHPLASGETLRQTLQLALEEVNGQGGLGPAGFNLRVCDTHGDAARAAAEAGYLASRGVVALFTVGVEETLAVAEKAIPASMMVFGLDASSSEVAALPDSGLVWSTAPSEARVGERVARLVADEAGLQKVALLGAGGPEAERLAEGFRAGFTANASGRELKSFGFSRGPGLDEVLDQADAFAPDAVVVVVASADEAVQVVRSLGTHEALARSRLFFLGVGREARLLEAVRGEPRLKGVSGAFVRPPAPEAVEGFRWRYRLRFQGEPDAAAASARAHDALYCTALAAVASAGPSGEPPLTGPQLAQGMSRLLSGVPATLGPLDFSTTRGDLQRGLSVKVEGVSGGLAFDPLTGEEDVHVEEWHIVDGLKE